MSFNIAIDGPSGAGKSTIAKAVAEQLGFIYVDTGAMYRALAVHFIRNGIDAGDGAGIAEALEGVTVTIAYDQGMQQVLLNGENVTGLLRTEDVGNMASATGVYGPVRRKLLDLQRTLAASADVIMDGRDIGTNILPDAQLKIYLTATAVERARRRFKELTDRGQVCDMAAIEKDIIERDERDMNREIAPLRQAEDAVYLDTSHMTIDEVICEILRLYESRRHEMGA